MRLDISFRAYEGIASSYGMILVLLISDFLAVTESSDDGAERKPYVWRKRPITKFEGRDLCGTTRVSIRGLRIQFILAETLVK